MLTSILQDTQELKLYNFQVPVVKAPIFPATFWAMCSDRAKLAIKIITPSELVRSLSKKRILADCLKLREQSEWAYLIIAGELRPAAQTVTGDWVGDGKRQTAPNWEQISNILLSVQETGVAVCQIVSTDVVGDYVQSLAARDRSQRRIRPARDLVFMEPAEDILLALPGVGDMKTQQLLGHTNGNAAWALMILTDDQHQFDGIGTETRRKVREALGLSDDMAFRVEVVKNVKNMEKAA